jgi:hypothetical protein
VSGFSDPIVGGAQKLIRTAIQSQTYVPGSAGWIISRDGSAEFNNLSIRGTFNGTDYVINSSGAFFYGGVPAAGNLVLSSVPGTSGGTDQFGNNYLPGAASYQGNFASQVGGGFLNLYHGSLAAGWTLGGTIETSSTGGLILDAGGGTVTITGALSVNGSTSTAAAGLTDGTVNGTSSTAGLTNGTINGTSGAASAGTAHTHGAGSYAVNNGQHSHSSGSYAVANGNHSHVL